MNKAAESLTVVLMLLRESSEQESKVQNCEKYDAQITYIHSTRIT